MTNIGGLSIVPQYYSKVEHVTENTLIFLISLFACMICKENLTLMQTSDNAQNHGLAHVY